MSLVDVAPVRRFFWRPAGVIAEAPRWLASEAGSGRSGVERFREVQPEKGRSGHVCYVAELAKGKVIGDALLAATADNLVLGNVQGLHGVSEPANHWIVKRRRFRRPRRIAGTALLLAAASGGNYFHWIFESLPRLGLVELAGFDLAEVDSFLLNQRTVGYHRESLDRIGIPKEKQRLCSKGELLEVERLIVPSAPAVSGGCPAWACQYLRRKLLPAGGLGSGQRRIYISRRQARGRKWPGEEEQVGWLRERGFEIVCLEQKRFDEQVELFASARVVVGVHGAGMSNLVFAPAGCSVLEIFPAVYQQVNYQELAGTMGFKYRRLVGKAGGGAAGPLDEVDVQLDGAEFRREVEAQLASSAAP